MNLIFTADSVPRALAVLIKFMNQSMINIEVYGVDIKQYIAADNSILIFYSIIGSGTTLEKQVVRSTDQWNADGAVEK